jgi:putative ABC transport system ATP-binding protein
MTSAIEAINLFKTYKTGMVDVEVLKGITLKIEQGDFLSIMGQSGSGKSTFLYIAGGLDKPTSGTVLINGRDITGMTDSEESKMRRRAIGFVFQFYNLIPNLNVEENIMLPAMLDGKKQEDYRERLTEMLDITGLAKRRTHRPGELSGGEQQRTALARALINKPDIILADEPTGNLDSNTGKEVLNLFKRINQERGLTIVMVTHSHDAAAVAGSTIFMKDGRF